MNAIFQCILHTRNSNGNNENLIQSEIYQNIKKENVKCFCISFGGPCN